MEEYFMKLNMVYMMVGGMKFYDRKEIKDILVYLCLISNNEDDISLICIVNVLKCGVGLGILDKLNNVVIIYDLSLFEVFNCIELVGILFKVSKDLVVFYDLICGFM